MRKTKFTNINQICSKDIQRFTERFNSCEKTNFKINRIFRIIKRA